MGNVSFLKYPNQGYYSYENTCEILKSCDIYEPLKINLLAVKNLSQTLQRFIGGKEVAKETPQAVTLMSYVVPQATMCDAVADLLADCAVRRKDDGAMRRNLVDPGANYGQNSDFTKGFTKIKFKLEQTKVAGKKRPKESFTMMPKYIQI